MSTSAQRDTAPRLDELLARPELAATLSADTAQRLLAPVSEQLARLFGLQVILATRAALGASGNIQLAAPDAGLPRYLTVKQAAVRTGFAEPYIQALCRTNKLPGAHKPGNGKYWLIPIEALAAPPRRGLDDDISVTLRSPRDRRGGPRDPQAAGTLAGGLRQAHRRALGHGQPVGDRRDGYPRDDSAPHAAPGRPEA